jgi:hypothetical protein
VLPSTARRGIPVVTVNMDVAEMKLFRVGDRSLAQLLSGYQFLRQLDNYDLDTVSSQLGAPVWEGELAIANELNKEITTSFPVDEALPDRKPGVYVLTAQPKDDRTDSWVPRATQWFVVSDIGLSTYTGQDGLNVFARSLGTAKPIADIELTLLARNNEILGTASTCPTAAWKGAPRPARSTSMPGPSVASTAPARSCMWPHLPATIRPMRSKTCRSPSSSRAPTASRTAALSPTAPRPAAMPSISACRQPPCVEPGPSRSTPIPRKPLSPARTSWSRISCLIASSST